MILGASLVLVACGDDDGGAGDEAGSETGMDTDAETGTDTGEEMDANLVEIPGASFDMGCGESNSNCDLDNPLHSVTLSSFWIELTEVTVLAYTECVDAGECTEPAGAGPDCNYGSIPLGNHPVNCLDWQQAADYCAWKGRRLPTEAEWELAARGTNGLNIFPWGTAAADCDRAHMFSTVDEMGDYGCMTGQTAEVGSYPDGASPYGLFDMAGNVEEWVADWYAADYYETGPTSDPQGPDEGTQRVVRGGDLFDASPDNLRVFERSRFDPSFTAPERGFRCAMDM